MLLTLEQQERIADWVHSKGINRDCPACGYGPTKVSDNLKLFQLADATDGSGVYPAVVMVCHHCAHLRYFSAKLMGVVRPA